MPIDLAPATALSLALAALAAGLARGFSGFGAALIFMPLGAALVGPTMAAPLLLVIDAATTLPLLHRAWGHAQWRPVGVMTLGALAGLPLGAWVLVHADPLALRWLVLALVCAMLGLLLSGWRYAGRPHPAATLGVGALAGFGSGVAQVAGPPVVAYWLGGAMPVVAARANMILYFAAANVIGAVTYWSSGLLTARLAGPCLVAAPAYGVGVLLGARAFGLAGERTFRRICYAMIALAAILGLPLLDPWLR